jgi:LPS-assembly protein
MKTAIAIITATLAIGLATAPSWGAASSAPGDGIHIVADTMEHSQADEILNARGNVVLHWQGATLSSDQATYDRPNNILTASGNVVISKGGDTVRGESLRFDLDSGRGELSNGSVFMKQGNMRITGESFIRKNENDYAARQGSYTTCDDPVPSWKFRAGDIDLTLDDYGSARDVVFYIKDVPVFYFPYIPFPVKKDRQSGFLFPRFSWSDKKGAEADIFYYWAISPSQEATIDLDIQTKRGVGAGADYRYLRKRGSTGNLGGYLIYDLNTESLRGFLVQSHREIFSPEMNLRTSVNMTTDLSFLSDYGEKSGVYNRQYNDSTVNFLKTWQHYALTADLRYTQDYFVVYNPLATKVQNLLTRNDFGESNNSTLQTLPEIGLAAVRQQIFSTPFYFDLDSRATNFHQENGYRGQRLYGFPRLTLAGGLPGYLNVSAYGGVYLRAYNTGTTPPANPVPENTGSLLPETGVRISSSFGRVYNVGGERLLKLRHELVPEFAYTYTLNQDQSRFPQYDYSDRIVYQNMLYYSLTSFLGGKFRTGDTTEYRDLLRLKLSQGYSISGTRRNLLTMVDDGRPWTDISLETEAWMHPQASLSMVTTYNVYSNYISSATPRLEFYDQQGTSTGISYRYSRNEVNYIEGRLSTRLLNPWTFSYSTRYSFDARDFLSSLYTAEYRHQCWSITLSYLDRRGPNPSQAFTVNFNLMGAFGIGSPTGGMADR